MNETKISVVFPIRHIKYHNVHCNGNLIHINSEKMISKYQCEKCKQFIKVIHGRSLKEIDEFKKKFKK